MSKTQRRINSKVSGFTYAIKDVKFRLIPSDPLIDRMRNYIIATRGWRASANSKGERDWHTGKIMAYISILRFLKRYKDAPK